MWHFLGHVSVVNLVPQNEQWEFFFSIGSPLRTWLAGWPPLIKRRDGVVR